MNPDTATKGVDAAPRSIHVRCHELAPVIGDLPANLAMIEDAIREAAADNVQLLVLPELATSGYYFRDAAEALPCALPTTDAVFDRWAALLPPGMVAVIGFCEDHDGTIFNSAIVLTAVGVLAVYRKTHLWDFEQQLFTPGAEPPPVVQTPIGALGVLICYDLEFPEMPRSLALRGADIVAVPTNWPVVPRPGHEHPPEVVQAMAAARSSALAIVCCDRRGTERGYDWTQGTSVIGCDGWPTGSVDTQGKLDATIVLAPDRTRIGPLNDVFSDRRPELYA